MACVLGKKAGIKLSWLLELSGANSTQSELAALMFNVRSSSVKNVGPQNKKVPLSVTAS
jgi:hypothetical protein